jgi:NAD-dependent deacetylase
VDSDLTDNIRQVADLLADAQRVCCLTGAGVSAESGIPTFRGPDGLWEGRRPEEVATPEAFDADPQDVWRFYLWRRKKLAACKPNAGHHAMARLEELVPGFTLITQNVDNLHRLGGSQRIIELHGNIWINRCTGRQRMPGQPQCPDVRAVPDDGCDEIPFCPACGSMMRPGVVWFGEMLPSDEFAEAINAARECQVMLVVGTSAVVHPAASIATWAAEAGATLVEINPDATPLSGNADYCLTGPSGEILPAVVASMRA